jgi:membrane protease subunit (stomatin/prohibitin family)
MKNASKNPGMAGTFMGAGVGIGAGAGIGAVFTDAINGATKKETTTTTTTVKTKNCPNCNAEIKSTAKFCSECGHKFATKKFCPNCGAEVKATAKFCSECGEKI